MTYAKYIAKQESICLKICGAYEKIIRDEDQNQQKKHLELGTYFPIFNLIVLSKIKQHELTKTWNIFTTYIGVTGI